VSGYSSAGLFHSWNTIRYTDETGSRVEAIADATCGRSGNSSAFISFDMSSIDYYR